MADHQIRGKAGKMKEHRGDETSVVDGKENQCPLHKGWDFTFLAMDSRFPAIKQSYDGRFSSTPNSSSSRKDSGRLALTSGNQSGTVLFSKRERINSFERTQNRPRLQTHGPLCSIIHAAITHSLEDFRRIQQRQRERGFGGKNSLALSNRPILLFLAESERERGSPSTSSQWA